MRRYRKLLGAIALSTTLLASPLGAESEPFIDASHQDDTKEVLSDHLAYEEAIRLADIWLGQIQQYERIPAISASIVVEDSVWANGYGTIDRSGRIPADADTIYSICSISKLFTAVAFMQQWEKGTVRLDEPVTTYLPWAKLAEDERESVPITMRGLLTHSAGLPREAVNPYWTGPNFPFPSRDEIQAGISSQQLLYPASRTLQYSNLGLTLVGETVEEVSGRPYGDYVTTNILQPLGMKNTRPFIQADQYGRSMAVGWGALKSDGTRPPVKLFDARGINPAAGFSSNVKDLAKFASWQLRLLKHGEPELLRASTLREMHRVHYLAPDRRTSWGIGFANFQLNGREIVGHGGSCPGYRSQLLIDPASGAAIAVAMNTMESAGGIARRLGALLTNRFESKSFAQPEGEVVNLSDYAGFYDPEPWDRESVVVPWAGGLAALTASDDDPAENLSRLKPLGNDRFRVIRKNGEERDIVTFYRAEDGSIAYMSRFGQFTPFTRPLD
jgi:CubicO group peptidase (beta-lactamase class C family)